MLCFLIKLVFQYSPLLAPVFIKLVVFMVEAQDRFFIMCFDQECDMKNDLFVFINYAMLKLLHVIHLLFFNQPI
jgi:hypothetical protein